uniref:Uncharacterized protein n=1 Tax=Picea glauca TaxID=3330 RepID=A0A117NIZ7_PICGL|nr:hypothetical protein ABT39_MTgene595 [Picea glauca]QHR87542.1 hypothetical protein Q903MT_gene1553 [Picea sitchensis]
MLRYRSGKICYAAAQALPLPCWGMNEQRSVKKERLKPWLTERKSLASKKRSGRSLRSLVIERYQPALPSATARINRNDQR